MELAVDRLQQFLRSLFGVSCHIEPQVAEIGQPFRVHRREVMEFRAVAAEIIELPATSSSGHRFPVTTPDGSVVCELKVEPGMILPLLPLQNRQQ